MNHLRHPSPHIFAEMIGSGGLFALAKRLAESGLTWESAAALIGACGTLLLGVGSVIREVRAMRAAKA